MNHGRFDDLVQQFQRRRIGDGRPLWAALSIGLGAVGLGGRAAAQDTRPPATTQPVQLGVPPTPTAEEPGGFAARPTPTTPSSVPRDPTPIPEPVAPTPTVTARPPERTPTPPPAERTSTPQSETLPPSPTPEPADESLTADQPDDSGMIVFDPFNWFCAPGPFWPWYPVVAPPDVTDSLGIRWYGFQVDEADERFIAAAFDEDGQELSRGEVRRGSARRFDWSLANSETRIEAAFDIDGDEAGGLRLAGELAGQPLAIRSAPDGSVEIGPGGAPALDIIQLTILAQWSAIAPKSAGVIDVFAATNAGQPIASQGKCFAAGFLLPASIVGCAVSGGIGCVPFSVFGGYLYNNCTD